MAAQPAPSHDPALALALAESARRTQLALRAEMAAQVARIWPLLNLARPAQTWPAWLSLMSGLLTQYHARFAAEGALLYRGARQFELGVRANGTAGRPGRTYCNLFGLLSRPGGHLA